MPGEGQSLWLWLMPARRSNAATAPQRSAAHSGASKCGIQVQGLGLRVRGLSASGSNLEADIFDATTCSGGGACSFTRTVTAVPEPGTWAMMAVGVAVGVAVLAGRRRVLSKR